MHVHVLVHGRGPKSAATAAADKILRLALVAGAVRPLLVLQEALTWASAQL